MVKPPQLYPTQSAIVSKVRDLPAPRRAILAWETGCGKTAGAIALITASEHSHTLVVCPAMVRTHWQREVARWSDNKLTCGVITQSRRSIQGHGTLLALEKWDKAFDSNVLITSYELLDTVIGCATKHQFSCLILDELHHIANPRSEQSLRVARIIRGLDCKALAPDAEIYGLTATPIPTECKQIWNPLRLLEGEKKWGKPVKNGDIGWAFRKRYCESEITDWGETFYGLREDRRAELALRMSTVMFPLTREQVLPDMPPLDLGVLTGDPQELLRDRSDVHKLVVLTHTRWDAAIYYKALQQLMRINEVYNPRTELVTGDIPVKKRLSVLEECGAHPDAVRVACTYDSVLEGIRLLWPDEVLIFDWGASPGKLLQILGRFASVGSTRRPRVRLVASDDTFGAAQSFAYRAKAIADLGIAGKSLNEINEHVANTGEVEPDWDALFSAQDAARDDWSEDANAD